MSMIALNKKIYVFFSILSLLSTLLVILLGIKYVPLNVYSVHLQSLAILSAAGILDYLFLNRLELASVGRFNLIKRIIGNNNFLLIVFLIFGVISVYHNILFFWLSLFFIRHYLNIRRSVMIIGGKLSLSYVTYSMQVLRNLVFFVPEISLELYKSLYLLSFVPEILCAVAFFRPNSGKDFYIRKIKFRFFSDSFQYRFFYVAMDLMCRVLIPFFLAESQSANYLYVVNLISFPVAGYSLCGALIHAHILKNKRIPNLIHILVLTALLSVLCFLFFVTINSNDNGLLILVLLAMAASLKTQDQILISFYVSQGYFLILKRLFFIGFMFVSCSALFVYFYNKIALEITLTSMIFSSLILYFSVFRFSADEK
ncbi:hypothetical protein ACNPDB_002108 [Vibrio vulnificus]|nr:hypothetical protein [Vibrio vulnificus]